MAGAHFLLRVSAGELGVLVELGQEVLAEGLEVVCVFLSDVGQGDAGGVLEADELAEGGLALDDDVRGFGGSAELREPADEFDRVAVGRNDDELGSLVFN